MIIQEPCLNSCQSEDEYPGTFLLSNINQVEVTDLPACYVVTGQLEPVETGCILSVISSQQIEKCWPMMRNSAEDIWPGVMQYRFPPLRCASIGSLQHIGECPQC